MNNRLIVNLYEEIRQLNQAKFDIQKSKLISVAAILALALALNGATDANSMLALFAIPFVNIYCDLLLKDYDSKLLVISAFLKFKNSFESEYHEFICHIRWCTKSHSNPLQSGSGAVALATYISNSGTAIISLYLIINNQINLLANCVLIVVAFAGMFSTRVIEKRSSKNIDDIFLSSKEFKFCEIDKADNNL